MSQYIALLQGSTAQAAFDQIVADAGALIAAAGAILVSWKGRARWEPWEEDVPKGPQQAAGLVTAVAIGVLWFYAGPDSAIMLTIIAIGALILTILFLFTYGYLISQQTYKKEVVIDGQPVEKNIIGGFRLTDNAKRQIAGRGISIQDYFKGTEYTEDEVWMRGWRALAKQVFVLVYIGLVASGSIALAAMALLVGLRF